MEKVPVVSIFFVFILVIGVWYGSMLAENQNILDHSPRNLSINVINQTVNQTQNQFNQLLNTTTNPSNINRTNGTDNVTNRTNPENYTVKTIFSLKIPMHDGVKLVSDVWMPPQDGKYPVILVRTPYMRDEPTMNYTGLGNYFASQGYVFVAQDVRGRGDSQGEFNFLFQEGQDGYDSIEWVAQQPWSNGKVGMMGPSYLGTVQWLAAREKPPHLVCIAPTSAIGRYMQEIPYRGGVFYMGWALPWTLKNQGRTVNNNPVSLELNVTYQHRPLITADEVTGTQIDLYRQFLEHPTMDDYWKRIQFTDEDFTRFSLPTLTITGWFDHHQPGALFYWDGLNKHFSHPEDQYLRIGPWTDTGTFNGGNGTVSELEFPDSIPDVKAVHLAFFDRYLKNSTNFNVSRVSVYITGVNEWLNMSDYPVNDINFTSLYLSSIGPANNRSGNGSLLWNFTYNQSLNKATDNYIYDPANPRPLSPERFVSGGVNVENRSDVLVYTTPPLEEPVMILGPVAVEFYASTDARDTDFTAGLMDVQPDGSVVNLGCEEFGGAIRARYRQGFEREVLLEPGTIEKYRIDLFDIGHVFLPGHRIRLEISSSAYPLLHPNPNTGNPIATDTQSQIAHQTIYHDVDHQSTLILPVIPANSTLYKKIFA